MWALADFFKPPEPVELCHDASTFPHGRRKRSADVRFTPESGHDSGPSAPLPLPLTPPARRILRSLMEKWPPSSGAAIVWKFSRRSLRAAGLRTQRQSLVPRATEEL